ncbi:hypothetical protein BGW36DRAFT_53451 [Talaromyces proteolyticus]|uniref:Uncharacterized protein n=1 Tax=Talaromyces proteolyticus TaxID=1131652 RepID=A0AAD4KGY4_9EURO|nr:uncharacterized protein BGW36DRAFT_53451 [Talaromyces proteolyticus]KAH8691480.1 hypothetical protein BGW36DRAFT_53451 [Talaromyces proteolyticus]
MKLSITSSPNYPAYPAQCKEAESSSESLEDLDFKAISSEEKHQHPYLPYTSQRQRISTSKISLNSIRQKLRSLRVDLALQIGRWWIPGRSSKILIMSFDEGLLMLQIKRAVSKKPFSTDERLQHRSHVREGLINLMISLLSDQVNETPYSHRQSEHLGLTEDVKIQMKHLIQELELALESREITGSIVSKSEALHETLYQLWNHSSHFWPPRYDLLNSIARIAAPDYIPSDRDIITTTRYVSRTQLIPLTIGPFRIALCEMNKYLSKHKRVELCDDLSAMFYQFDLGSYTKQSWTLLTEILLVFRVLMESTALKRCSVCILLLSGYTEFRRRVLDDGGGQKKGNCRHGDRGVLECVKKKFADLAQGKKHLHTVVMDDVVDVAAVRSTLQSIPWIMLRYKLRRGMKTLRL